MFLTFNSTGADDAWLKAVELFREPNVPSNLSSRAGETIEQLHVGLSVSSPEQRWVISRNPPLNPAFALAEIVWILNGRNDSPFLNYFNSRLPEYAGHTPTYPGSYGFRLRHHFGIDQLSSAYQSLRSNPSTRQVVLQIWDSKTDFPGASGAPSSADVPCNVVSILKVREGKLEWLQVMRSNDLMLGLPYNLVQFTTLQEVLAGWLGVKVGTYNHISDSLHVYCSQIEWLKGAKPIESKQNTDVLALPKEESEAAFGKLSNVGNEIIDSRTGWKDLRSIVKRSELPVGFQNMLRVMSAEGARKRKHTELSEEIMSECTNPIFRQLWARWASRSSTPVQQLSIN